MHTASPFFYPFFFVLFTWNTKDSEECKHVLGINVSISRHIGNATIVASKVSENHQ